MTNNKYWNIFPSKYSTLVNGNEWKERICPDEIIGFIHKENSTILFEKRSDYQDCFLDITTHNEYCKSKNIKINKRIAIVLESPHTDEFFNKSLNVFKSLGTTYSRPANGSTGENLYNYIVEIFYEKIRGLDDGIYSISLINSIQQQCSLGVNTKYFRDRMWLHSWFDSNINNFAERLTKFKPDIVFICTTVGEHFSLNKEKNGYVMNNKKTEKFTKKFFETEFKHIQLKKVKNIRVLVTDFVKDILPNTQIYSSTHPSSWWSSRNRKVF
jgi:hypothetical protein